MDSGNSIKIEGPPDEADKARDILENQANELKTKMSFAEISIDAKYHKHIIGKGGSNGKIVHYIPKLTEIEILLQSNLKLMTPHARHMRLEYILLCIFVTYVVFM